MIKYALDEYGISTQSAQDEASSKLQKLVHVNITERRVADVRNWLMIIRTAIVEWRKRRASSEMVEQFATALVLALENMKDTCDGMVLIRNNGGQSGQKQINGTKCSDPTMWKIMLDIPR